MNKKVLFSETAYILGLVLIALGVALMEKANFGVSMVVAPAYLLYRWINPVWSVFTFGMAEYCLQAALLIAMMLVLRKFRVSFLFSFVTAVIYGFLLDGCMALAAFLPTTTAWRLLWYVLGMLLCSAGVSMIFHTYISPEVYELFVKEVSEYFGVNINRFKTGYDCVSCLVGLIMSFAIFGMWKFVGVSWGTVLCALINGSIIGAFSSFYEKHLEFKDRFPWRPFFEGRKNTELF